MQLLRSFEDIGTEDPICLSIGTFDGLHVGHGELLRRLVQRAKTDACRSVLVTFEPHPQQVVRRSKPTVRVLTSVDEKVALLRSAGLDTVALVRFTNKIAAVGAESFVETLAQTVRLRGMVVGESHAFGSGRKGNPALLVELGRRFGFWTEVVPPVRMDGETVSSTRIRTLLAEGAVEKANRFLGRHYRVEGRVVEGKKLGSRLGFPTANLVPEPADKCVPGNGVYAVFVRIGGDSAIGSANIGTAPTTGKKPRGLEVHVHGWSGELYGNRVAVEFVRRLRDERAFPSLDALADQIQKDKEESRKWLS